MINGVIKNRDMSFKICQPLEVGQVKNQSPKEISEFYLIDIVIEITYY